MRSGIRSAWPRLWPRPPTRRVLLSTVQPCEADAWLKLGPQAALLGLILSLGRPNFRVSLKGYRVEGCMGDR